VVARSASAELAAKVAGAPVRLIGHVLALKETTTRRGSQMAFLTLEDMEGTVEVTVFPELFKAAASRLRSREAVLIRGRLDESDKGRVVWPRRCGVSTVCTSPSRPGRTPPACRLRIGGRGSSPWRPGAPVRAVPCLSSSTCS
jgi:DNA polymerase III alpha subunit